MADDALRVLHLFAGGGGGLLADLILGHRIIGAVEWEPAAQQVLAARQADGSLPPFPIFGDVRAFVAGGYARCYRGVADVVAGGFPCQPFSVAGKRAGHADERNMWPAMRDVVAEVQPRIVFAENVPGLLGVVATGEEDEGEDVGGAAAGPVRYFGTLLGDLADLGYDCRWGVLGADDAGAPHKRKRLWIVAHRDGR